MTAWLLRGGRLLLPEGRIVEGDCLMVDGHVAAAGPDLPAPAGCRIHEAQGRWIVPGYLDTHLHGGLEADTMDASPEALAAIARHLARHGITSWLPTTVACGAPLLGRVLDAVSAAMATPPPGARILGAHLESNFLAPKYKGAQPPECLRPIGDPDLDAEITRHASTIRLVTLAPELPGSLGFIKRLRALGITVAVGHTDATYDQVMAAVDAGATRVTHLCNAQRGFHHREPGVVGAGLSCDRLRAEIIADTVHVHPAGLLIAARCKGAEGLMLVSDALRGAGLPPGRHELGGQVTVLDGTVARLEDGTLAGSVITLDQAVRTMIRTAGVTLADAVRMASETPARSLGLRDRGRLDVGAWADVNLLDEEARVQATWIAGERQEA